MFRSNRFLLQTYKSCKHTTPTCNRTIYPGFSPLQTAYKNSSCSPSHIAKLRNVSRQNTWHFIGMHPLMEGDASYFRLGNISWSYHILKWPLSRASLLLNFFSLTVQILKTLPSLRFPSAGEKQRLQHRSSSELHKGQWWCRNAAARFSNHCSSYRTKSPGFTLVFKNKIKHL